MDRLSRRIDQLGKAETFSYDGIGNLVSTTDRKNQTTTFIYDALNRRTQASYSDGATAAFTYDATGRLSQADDTADPHRPITRSYDPLDRLLTETTTLGTVTYAYDTAGRRTSMSVSGQAPVSYTYDHNSRLRTITQAPLNPVDIQHDAANRRTLLTLPNGVSTEYQYDVASRLTALIYRNALGLLGDLTYQYDPSGNRTGVAGSFARTLLPDPVPSATYDAANRQLAFGDKQMTSDPDGNLATLTDPSGTTTFTWDVRSRLLALASLGMSADFAYDALGRRARKAVAGGHTAYQYDGPDGIRIVTGGTELRYLGSWAVDEPLVQDDGAATRHFLADGLGSAIALTDAQGAVAAGYAYVRNSPTNLVDPSGLLEKTPPGRKGPGTRTLKETPQELIDKTERKPPVPPVIPGNPPTPEQGGPHMPGTPGTETPAAPSASKRARDVSLLLKALDVIVKILEKAIPLKRIPPTGGPEEILRCLSSPGGSAVKCLEKQRRTTELPGLLDLDDGPSPDEVPLSGRK